MYALGSLLPHQSCTQMKPLDPVQHVVFKKMHFRENCCFGVAVSWELLPVPLEKYLDVEIYEEVNTLKMQNRW